MNPSVSNLKILNVLSVAQHIVLNFVEIKLKGEVPIGIESRYVETTELG